jgi:hypothetical protein
MSVSRRLEHTFLPWKKEVEQHGSADIQTKIWNGYMVRVFCKANNYVSTFVRIDKDNLIYAVAKSKELLLKHETER